MAVKTDPVKTEIVWEGAEALRDDLVPVADLRTHPNNPRRGVVPEIARSLARFGQVRPILTFDGTIVAGNHTYLAACSLGWTHIAVIPNEFASEEEARAYLLADNRLPELGGYDTAQLAALLAELAGSAAWEGTGYTASDLERLQAQMSDMAAPPPPPPAPPPSPGTAEQMHEVVLLYPQAGYDELGRYIQILSHEWGEGDVIEIIYRAIELEARRLNQEEAA